MIDFQTFPFNKKHRVNLSDEDLNIEQLPQILKLMNAEEIFWKYNAIIQGVDGSRVKVQGNSDKEYIVLTPLEIKSIPWNFPKLNSESIINLVKDLLPCNEGEGYINPAPWDRVEYVDNKWIHMRSGEVTDNLKIVNSPKRIEVHYGSIKISTNFYNPFFHFLNPFFIQTSKKPIDSSSFISIESIESIAIISSLPFNIQFNNGNIDVQGNSHIYLVRLKNWNEENQFKINWNLRNSLLRIDCKPKYNVSLYRIEPSVIIPIYFNYDIKEKILYLSVINMSNEDIVSTIYFSAKVEKSEVDGEEVIPEFDRIRFPIRRWRIKNLKIRLKKLIEAYLKRKIVT